MKNNSKRSVEANELQSTELPCLQVQIESSLEYIGNLKTDVLDKVCIDNYYFVEKNTERQIQRILYFQFEEFLNNNEDIFAYPNMQDIKIGEHDFGYDGGVRIFKHSKIDEQAENSDVRQTVDFLESKKIQFAEGEFYGALRFAEVMDNGRNDMLVIYLERLEEASIPGGVVAKSRYSEEWSEFCEQLLARALRTFTICSD